MVPFSKPELASISKQLRDVALGLIHLALPDCRPNIGEHYRPVLERLYGSHVTAEESHDWNRLFESVVNLLRQLYERDVRIRFCAEGSWSVPGHIKMVNFKEFRRGSRRGTPMLFGDDFLRALSRQELGKLLEIPGLLG